MRTEAALGSCFAERPGLQRGRMELGAGEIVVILAIVVLLFGPSKLPKLGEGLGSAMANFRKALRGDDEPKRAADPADAPPAAASAPAPGAEPGAASGPTRA